MIWTLEKKSTEKIKFSREISGVQKWENRRFHNFWKFPLSEDMYIHVVLKKKIHQKTLRLLHKPIL